LVHHPHQFAPHWMSTRVCSRRARASAASISLAASAVSS